jgi:hypothetical protein
MPLPDDALTPLLDCRLLEVLDEEDDDEVVPDEVEVWPEEVADELPGIVSALTALKTPTAATEANAAPNVIRLSRRSAASRACTRRSLCCVLSMAHSLRGAAKAYLGAG